MSIRRRIVVCALAFSALSPFGVAAQNEPAVGYPNKPVTLIIPYPPGGTSHVVGRLLAQRLREELGENFNPDNKPAPGARGRNSPDVELAEYLRESVVNKVAIDQPSYSGFKTALANAR